MKKFFSKPYRWAAIFSIVLTLSFTYVLLDTFVIPKSIIVVTEADANDTTDDTTDNTVDNTIENAADIEDDGSSTTSTDMIGSSDTTAVASTSETLQYSTTESEDVDTDTTATQSEPVITDTSYTDENISITISTVEEYDSVIYIADVQVSDISYLQTAFANSTYGRNVKATTSEIAEDNEAIFAINGDFYGFRNYGYVLRNGVVYRDNSGDADALVIDKNGDFSIVNESDTSLDSLDTDSLWQVLSFGPALIEDGEIVVDSNSEVGQSMSSNPRTAIGQISALHYIFVVSDGRTNESAGLSLLELAQVFADQGCTTAYNLDGGGSATMYFNGEIVNVPTDGNSFGEREVSDIVYIGY